MVVVRRWEIAGAQAGFEQIENGRQNKGLFTFLPL
jgi:hypothetical protein